MRFTIQSCTHGENERIVLQRVARPRPAQVLTTVGQPDSRCARSDFGCPRPVRMAPQATARVEQLPLHPCDV
eukprot:3524282-Prymnesium_polylepis.1